MTRPLGERLGRAPRLAAPALARRRLDALLREPEAATLIPLAEPEATRELLLGVADHSPFLWSLIGEDPARLARLLASAPEDAFDALIVGVEARRDDTQEALTRALRRAKHESALLIALADLGGVWDVIAATEALSRFADAAVGAALRFLLRREAREGRLVLDADAPDIEADCGLVVLALGKHGARELNYSSDIDLIVLFDAEAASIPEGTAPAPLFVRLVQALTRLLQERTPDGYVFRVDLRLRPDPAATPVAMSLASAASYYETLGQNWERAAMIKARPAAGARELGRRFLAELAPFIWRKYFDYAAIADIHAMKRQIHAVRGHEQVTVAGHDLKLGRGGIREIEFFVQTQQLIFGGRRPSMRGARTLDMLRQLHTEHWVGAEAVDDLSAAYVFLRELEHRLQMVADEQTQRLPFETPALTRFAKFCGYGRLDRFSADLTGHLRRVERHYARLFEDAPTLDVEAGSLVFTGVVDDPDTLTTLRSLGFQRPEAAAETIRGWHFGRRPAVQGARAREVLTELVPALLVAFSGSGDADAALAAFDAALARMRGAVELLSILRSNAPMRELFGDLFGGAPRLAQMVADRPHVLDAAIDPGRVAAIGESLDEGRMAARVEAFLAQATTFEDTLDRARDFAVEETFLIGVRLLSAALDPERAGRAYSALAEALLDALLKCVGDNFAREYGRVKGGRVAVLAMGKFGSREMTAASDLDLIVIYDFPQKSGESSGARPLAPSVYYTRLTQRLLAALTAPTKAGKLYDVDLRLRPSGQKGPLATQFSAFRLYQAGDAETWEHMALTRARVVAGDRRLAAEIAATIADVLTKPRDAAKLAKDVRAMRDLIAREKGDRDPWEHMALTRARVVAGDRRLAAEIAATIGEVLTKPRDAAELARDVRAMRDLIAREKGDRDPWDLKLVSGGLIDIEFVAQYLTLRSAREIPALLAPSTRATLAAAAAAGALGQDDAEALIAAYKLYSDATQIMRVAVAGPFDPATATSGVKRRIAAAAGLPDFETLEGAVRDAREAVKRAYARILGGRSGAERPA